MPFQTLFERQKHKTLQDLQNKYRIMLDLITIQTLTVAVLCLKRRLREPLIILRHTLLKFRIVGFKIHFLGLKVNV